MTLDKLYRQINNKLGVVGDIDSLPFYHSDTVDAINRVIREVRGEFIKQGLGYEFTETETVTTTTEGSDYPFIGTATLSNTLLRSLPIELTVRQSIAWKTDNEIENTTQSFNKGDFAIKDGSLYRCVTSFSNVNTFDKTFEVKGIRNFYPGNGLTYKVGDVVCSGDDFYECVTEYTNNTNTAIGSLSEFEQLYWSKQGGAYYQCTYLPFDALHESKLTESIGTYYPFSIKENTVYAGFTNRPFTITYIPEWEDVTDLDTELNLPETMYPVVEQRVLQSFGIVSNNDESNS